MKSTGQSQASGPVNAQAQETLERATVSEASYGVRGRATPAHCSTSNQVDLLQHAALALKNYISLFTEPCSFNSLICEVVNPNSPDHSCLDASLAVTVRVALCPLPEGSFLAFPSKTSSSDLPANLSQFELLFQLVHSLIVTTSPSFIPIH
ncbi:hypothetical protein CBS147331_2793 [Penicillium roqueforti]|nr:hypothetical protein CBS147331_2793 [Penicillium roqueforti]